MKTGQTTLAVSRMLGPFASHIIHALVPMQIRLARDAGRHYSDCRSARLVPLALLLAAATATAQVPFSYEIHHGTVTVTKYTGFGRHVVIPDTIAGLPVISIGERAFERLYSVTSVTIPDSVISIGNEAFAFCSSLTSVTIPNGVTSIGDGAFSHCTSLTSVEIPDGVTAIGNAMFFRCSSLTSVTIPDSVTRIGNAAFSECRTLTNIIIPEGVTSIGNKAFTSCSSLTSVVIPDGVTSIGWEAFYKCTSLTNILLGKGVRSIELSAFVDCTSLTSIEVTDFNPFYSALDGVLLDKNQMEVVLFPPGRAGPYIIPDGITRIGDWAFYKCSGLTSVEIPDSVTIIGHGVFDSCRSLTAINVHPMNASYSSVEGVLFNKSETLLIQCPGDKSGDYKIPESVTNIGNFAFRGCTSLTSLTIGDRITSIGLLAFVDCTSVTTIEVGALNPAYSGMDGVLFNKSQTVLVQCPPGKAGHYTIPDSVTSIGERAFESCTRLISIVIPESVTSIGRYAFQGCFALTSIYFQGGAPSLGSHGSFVFSGSYNVTAYYVAGTEGWDSRFGGRPTALWDPSPDVRTEPEVHQSPVESLPLGSYETLERYGHEQVDSFRLILAKRIPEQQGSQWWYAHGDWWKSLADTSGSYEDKSLSVYDYMRDRVSWYLGQDWVLPFLIEEVIATNPDDRTAVKFMIEFVGLDRARTFYYVKSQAVFRLVRNGDTYAIPQEAMELELVPYGTGMYGIRWPIGVVGASYAILDLVDDVPQHFDTRDFNDPWGDMWTFSGGKTDWDVPGHFTMFVPLKYALGEHPGTLTLYYDEAGEISESFDLQTGIKLVPEEPHLRLIGSAEGMTLFVEGVGPSALTIEHAAAPAQWEPFATIENYTGLAWIRSIDPIGSHRFFRASGNP